jgi:hypothetical protein
MLKFYLLPAAAGLLFTITSCQKRHDPNNGTILRRSVTNTSGSGLVATNYVYDEDGVLVRLQLTTNPDNPNTRKEAVILEFNAAGYLTKSYNAEYGNSAYNIQEYTYNNRRDTIRSVITLYRLLQPAYTRQVVLDDRQRVISDSTRTLINNDVTFTSFTWDAAGNMATETSGLIVNGTLQISKEIAYTYDTHRNPFRSFGLSYYLATRDGKAFNVNNVQSWTENNLRYTWQINYNPNDLPLKAFIPAPNGGLKYEFYYR